MSLHRLEAELQQLESEDRLRRLLQLQGPQAPRITLEGRDWLAFCSNDYLGLANDARIVEALQRGLHAMGAGAGASHLVTGHFAVHDQLERSLAAFVGLPRALLFGTGYLANLGLITALTGPDDVILSDALNHASLIDGMRLSRARVERYAHADVDALRAALQAAGGRERFVVTESIFSMDGDLAPLGQMLELCEQHDAWLVIDDAHGFGVLGREGRGVLQALGLCSDRIIYVGTLGKAAGISGAFVAGADAVVETLLQKARSYIYTTAMPPFLAAGLQQSLDIIQAETWRRSQLQQLVATLKQGLAGTALRLLPSDSPIQPLLLGSNASAMAASTRLREQGLIVTAIRPPTVPAGTARLRLSLSALHQLDDVQCLVQALRDLPSGLPQSSLSGTA